VGSNGRSVAGNGCSTRSAEAAWRRPLHRAWEGEDRSSDAVMGHLRGAVWGIRRRLPYGELACPDGLVDRDALE